MPQEFGGRRGGPAAGAPGRLGQEVASELALQPDAGGSGRCTPGKPWVRQPRVRFALTCLSQV